MKSLAANESFGIACISSPKNRTSVQRYAKAFKEHSVGLRKDTSRKHEDLVSTPDDG